MKLLAVILSIVSLTLSATVAWAYSEQATSFETQDHLRLKGLWMLPDGEVLGAAVVLPESGNLGADARLSAQLATTLASIGVATLRYDKRGYADSSQLRNQKPSVLAQDARSALLELHRRFPGKKTALVGFDEGAILSVLVARELPVDGLFLLGMPTRTVDDSIRYQYFEWPMRLLATRMHVEGNNELNLAEFRARYIERLPLATEMPYLDRPVASFDLDHNGMLSLAQEVRTAYAVAFEQFRRDLARSPQVAYYDDLRALGPIAPLAQKLTVPATYIYQAEEDEQVDAQWYEQDLHYFPGRVLLRPIAEVGHAFAPGGGTLGEKRVSGPLPSSLLDLLAGDAGTIFYKLPPPDDGSGNTR